MRVDIGKHDFNIIWDGVYYYALSDYPNISDWELKTIISFIEYEKNNNREVEISSDNEKIQERIKYALSHKEKFINIERPEKITQCTACKHKGCLTKFLCHTASLENAVSIIKGGSILSSVKARRISKEELTKEKRNAANDPKDYFDYLMLSWGNCQAGDRLVMERKLERDPNEEDLSKDFTPGVRFYFKYNDLINHNKATFDGYHPLKIKDELKLENNVFAIIIPKEYNKYFEDIRPSTLKEKVYYLENDCKDIWEWSEKVYNFVEKL